MMIKRNAIITFLSLLLLSGCQTVPSTNSLATKHLEQFKSKRELHAYLKQVDAIHEYRNKNSPKRYRCDSDDDSECVIVVGSRLSKADVSITNNQVAGVDEGDIVKKYKNYLIVLRKGKLFAINIGEENNKQLKKVFEIDVFTPGWKHEAWIDEILIDRGVVLVLGYNYELGVSELIRFNLTESGKLSYKDTHLIKSSDYFDSGNYASRLFNHNYTSYIPIALYDAGKLNVNLPRIAKVPKGFNGNESLLEWRRLIKEQNIYKPLQTIIEPVLHSFIRCPLSSETLSCQSVGVIGSWNSEYYITGENIYLWTSGWRGDIVLDYQFDPDMTLSGDDSWLQASYEGIYKDSLEDYYDPKLYRISIEKLLVEVASTSGRPVNQFSFHHNNEALYMLSQIDSEQSELIKIPDEYFDSYGNNRGETISSIPALPLPLNNRFLKDYLILGSQSYYGEKTSFQVLMIEINNGDIHGMDLLHTADRIEVIKENAFIAGVTENNGLGLSLVSPRYSELLNQTVFEDRLEGEYRSHAFNYGEIDGVVIAGISSQKKALGTHADDLFYWDEDIASDVTFVGGSHNQLNLLGELQSKLESTQENCDTSCIDWYGNTRPFFVGRRIFAMTGDELIEASLIGQSVIEVRRLAFAGNEN